MKIIYKYELLPCSTDLYLPRNAWLLDVQVQNGIPMLWALVDTEEKTAARKFHVYPTGAPIKHPSIDQLFYVATFQLEGGKLVFHLFEEMES